MEVILSAFITSFILTVILLPLYIKWIKRVFAGQQVREEGPAEHLKKSGTPTMGGVIILISFFSCILWVKQIPGDYLIFLGIVLANGMLGLADDFLQVMKKRALGLRARDKLFVQIIMGAVLSYYLWKLQGGFYLWIPFIGEVESPVLFILLILLVLAGSSNAANLTDGLDGLAAGLGTISLAAYGFISWKIGKFDLAVGAASLAASYMGFLWFNIYPARIFMGDTGSLALGGALAALAILTRTEFLLIVIGGVFVAETLSVIIQVSYFQVTKRLFKLDEGKRVFKMAPLHHHLELTGWHETQVTVRFWIMGIILALVGIFLYFK